MNQVNTLGNRYYVGDKFLGKGSFGEVVQGFDTYNNKVVAIKKVAIKKLQTDPKLTDLFDQETKLQQSLNSPFIVKLHNVYKDQQYFYLVLDYCEDGNLNEYLKKNGPLPEQQAIGFLLQILAGFKALHSKSIIHRDFKPANVLLHGKQLKIADLGASRVIQNGLDASTKIGSPLFFAPELIEGKGYGFEVDIFSLGVLLYYMLYNHYPFKGTTELQLHQSICLQAIDFKKNGIIISREMQNLIQLLLKFNREERISWKEIYEHPIISNNIKNNNISAGIILTPSIDDISMYDDPKFSYKKLKSMPVQLNQFKSVANEQKIKEVNKEEEEQKNELTELNLQKENDWINGKKKYDHKRNVFHILINLEESFRRIQNLGIDCKIPSFLVLKKLKCLNTELWTEIQEKINIFDMKFFDLFLKSAQYESISLAVLDDQLKIDELFKVRLEEAKNSIKTLNIHNQQLEDEINNKGQKELSLEFYQNSLINYTYVLHEMLIKTYNQEDKASLFYHIMLIYQAISIDKQFKDISNIELNFKKYKSELINEVEPKDYQVRMDEAFARALG